MSPRERRARDWLIYWVVATTNVRSMHLQVESHEAEGGWRILIDELTRQASPRLKLVDESAYGRLWSIRVGAAAPALFSRTLAVFGLICLACWAVAIGLAVVAAFIGAAGHNVPSLAAGWTLAMCWWTLCAFAGVLLGSHLPRRKIYVVEVDNSTPAADGTRTKYYIPVDDRIRPMHADRSFGWRQRRTARNAIASTFGLRGRQYRVAQAA